MDERPVDWDDLQLHYCKRELSRFEKTQLHERHREIVLGGGLALLMPAVPGTEVEELAGIGFDPRRIVCVEEIEHLADELYTHYWDECQVVWEEVGDFLHRARARYAYIHLDYCGHCKPQEIITIERAARVLAPYARVRVSTLLSRRLVEQIDAERTIVTRVLRPLCEAAAASQPGSATRWDTLYEGVAAASDDTTVSIAILILINAVFGSGAYAYSDHCAQYGPVLPDTTGTHRIIDVQRYVYNDSGTAAMASVWVDLAPAPSLPLRPGWALEELASVVARLAKPPTRFANPEIFHAPKDVT